MKLFNVIFLISSMCVFVNFSISQQNKNDLIILKNDRIELGILPEVGGRIVLLRLPGYDNILKADENQWLSSDKLKPKITPFTGFEAFDGHITWVSPQKEWWIHQSLNESRRKAKADWPPDPYLIYGKNKVISQTDTSLVLKGIDSPISNLRIDKTISISKDGKVTVTSEAENISDKNICWDLWMLTRLHGFANAFVPFSEAGFIDLVKKNTETLEATPYEIIDGFLTLNPSTPKHNKREQTQEFHIYPSSNFIVGFDKNQMLLIEFEMLKKEKVHPNHGLVELYSHVNKDGTDSLLELEVHGEYKCFAPGEKVSLTETWKLSSYKGIDDKNAQIEFLRKYIRESKKK